jgi:hypothetical protein
VGQEIGSFGFVKRRLEFRTKPNVPIERRKKNKKMRVGQKLNLSLSVRFSVFIIPLVICPLLCFMSVSFYHYPQRFSAWRSGGFRSTNVQFSTKVQLKNVSVCPSTSFIPSENG